MNGMELWSQFETTGKIDDYLKYNRYREKGADTEFAEEIAPKVDKLYKKGHNK